MRNAPCHGANGLHFLRLAQLRFKRCTVRFHFFTCGEVVRKQCDHITLWVMLKRQTHFERDFLPQAGEPRHLSQLGVAGDVAVT